MRKLGLFLVGLMLVLVGCADKAEPGYAKCLQLQAKGDVEAAFTACNDAVGVDPNSASGQKAMKLLTELKPAYEKAKADREAREAKEAEQRAKAAAEQAKAHADELRRTVAVEWYDTDVDTLCAGQGKPKFRWKYSGGTYAQNAELARADGCVPRLDLRGMDLDFCCPKAP